MPDVIETILQQFGPMNFRLPILDAIAGATSRQFDYSSATFDEEALSVSWHFWRRRRPQGAVVAPKVVVTVRYDAGADLYDVSALAVRGDFAVTEREKIEGVFVDRVTDTACELAAKAAREL